MNNTISTKTGVSNSYTNVASHFCHNREASFDKYDYVNSKTNKSNEKQNSIVRASNAYKKIKNYETD